MIAAKDQAGRIYQGSGLVPRLLSIILLIRIMYIFHGEDIIHVLRRLHKIGRGRGLCPQQERAAVPGCGTSAISSSDDKGDIQSERNNNTNIGKTTTTSVGDRRSRRGILFIWDYTGKQQQMPTSYDKGWYHCRTITKASTSNLKGGPRGTVWWIFRERVY